RDGRARRILAGDALGQLALLCVFLSPFLLPRLGAELCGRLSRALRRPARQLFRQLRQLVQLALQLLLVQQRLSPGAPLGSQVALDAHGRLAATNQAADGRQPDTYLARSASDRISRRLVAGPPARTDLF